MSARSPRCSTSTSRSWRSSPPRQFKGKEQAGRSQPAGAAHRLRRSESALRLPARHSRSRAATRSATAFSSKAISPPALGAVYGGATVCAWYPITPSTSLAEAFERNCARFRVDRATGKKNYAIRAGRGRDRGDRHGGRRGLERRARLHRDLRPRHFADAGILRPRLFRRDPGRRVRRAARRPVDRHADPHPAVGSSVLRLRLARRHQACAAPARRAGRGVRVRRERVRPRRAAADADLRHARSRHRHEFASDCSRSAGTIPGLRPRQGPLA